MPSKLLPKHVWKNAIGASQKPKRLHLTADSDGVYQCPVETVTVTLTAAREDVEIMFINDMDGFITSTLNQTCMTFYQNVVPKLT